MENVSPIPFKGPGAGVQVAFTEVIMILDFAFRILNWKRNSGGYCGGVPPLPIPNREVKPTYADGTAMQCGRVGSRLLFEKSEALRVAIFSGLL